MGNHATSLILILFFSISTVIYRQYFILWLVHLLEAIFVRSKLVYQLMVMNLFSRLECETTNSPEKIAHLSVITEFLSSSSLLTNCGIYSHLSSPIPFTLAFACEWGKIINFLNVTRVHFDEFKKLFSPEEIGGLEIFLEGDVGWVRFSV